MYPFHYWSSPIVILTVILCSGYQGPWFQKRGCKFNPRRHVLYPLFPFTGIILSRFFIHQYFWISIFSIYVIAWLFRLLIIRIWYFDLFKIICHYIMHDYPIAVILTRQFGLMILVYLLTHGSFYMSFPTKHRYNHYST